MGKVTELSPTSSEKASSASNLPTGVGEGEHGRGGEKALLANNLPARGGDGESDCKQSLRFEV